MGQVIDLGAAREKSQGKHAKISTSLKRLARENRHELFRSYPHIRFWLGDIQRQHYVHFLRLHLALHEALESRLTGLGDHFVIENTLDKKRKQFSISDYVSPSSYKSNLIRKDLIALNESPSDGFVQPAKLDEILGYIQRTSDAYSISLLGTLFVLEDNLACAGNPLADTLVRNGAANNFSLNYLSTYTHGKSDLWQFVQALDGISDFQTQANVVIAATLSYEMHRELILPKNIRRGSL